MILPICSKCNNIGEERWLVYSKFYYCLTCKIEIEYTDAQQQIDELLQYLSENTKIEIK